MKSAVLDVFALNNSRQHAVGSVTRRLLTETINSVTGAGRSWARSALADMSQPLGAEQTSDLTVTSFVTGGCGTEGPHVSIQQLPESCVCF